MMSLSTKERKNDRGDSDFKNGGDEVVKAMKSLTGKLAKNVASYRKEKEVEVYVEECVLVTEVIEASAKGLWETGSDSGLFSQIIRLASSSSSPCVRPPIDPQ
jgi:hypothetical protein